MEEEFEQIVQEQFLSTFSPMLIKHRDFMIICFCIPIAYHTGTKQVFQESVESLSDEDGRKYVRDQSMRCTEL